MTLATTYPDSPIPYASFRHCSCLPQEKRGLLSYGRSRLSVLEEPFREDEIHPGAGVHDANLCARPGIKHDFNLNTPT